ncbi:MFS general substrate transporter [Phellopilus nigrolimitatus]|nr:MFS general substrate transporter [Phellopilus nigrolimitatus]
MSFFGTKDEKMGVDVDAEVRSGSGLDDEKEKSGDYAESTVLDARRGDKALELVGEERTHEFSEEYNLKLRRKLDLLIPPICAAVYFTQFLDKTALNYASVMGFPIGGSQYNLVSMAFYLGYLAWEFPTVYIAQKMKLAKYLGFNIIVWGAILMCHAATDSFGAFFALRFLLGMFESCVSPILILIITMFYKKEEQAQRISWFYVMNGLTQIFGGFIAYGISFDDGKSLAPYKIIYILLGGLALVVGVAVLIWLPDSPVHARMLTKEERIAALERVRDDQVGIENKTFKKEQHSKWRSKQFQQQDYQGFWLYFVSSSKQTLILSTPGGFIASVTTMFCGWYSDKKKERMIPIVFALIPTIVGTAILIGVNSSGDKGALLFGIYITGTFGSALSTVYAYNASNTSGHTKKVTINAITMVAFSVGNIAYIPGKIAIMVLLIAQLFVSVLLRFINIRLNKKRVVALQAEKERRGWDDADVERERQRHAFMDLTDRQNIFFVYTA